LVTDLRLSVNKCIRFLVLPHGRPKNGRSAIPLWRGNSDEVRRTSSGSELHETQRDQRTWSGLVVCINAVPALVDRLHRGKFRGPWKIRNLKRTSSCTRPR